MATTRLPCIPYLGIFLSDLTFIEEGNPDSIVMEGVETINFVKRRKVADVIAKIQTYQVPYNFVPAFLTKVSVRVRVRVRVRIRVSVRVRG